MPRNAAERSMLGCFHGGTTKKRASLMLPPAASAYEDGSTSAASTSVGTGSPHSSSASTSSPAFLDDIPPLYLDDADADADVGVLSTAIASRRLFLASPGRSNSIVDSAEHAGPQRASGGGGGDASSSGRPPAAAPAAAAKGLHVCGDEPARPVPVSTAAPRAEFLKSMMEMVDAMGVDARRGADRAQLHELLLCYIALNERDALADILGAFTDLLFALNANGPAAAGVQQEGGAKRPEA